MSNIESLPPVTEDDYRRVATHITAWRDTWQGHLDEGLTSLGDHLAADGYTPLFDGDLPPVGHVALSGRLKDTAAIVAKMRRFGEPLRVILDIWGYRLVVPTETDLDQVAHTSAELWETPTPDELLLRHGELQFDWWRDYRRRDHAGLSPATTAGYDQAIHLNRRAPWGITEIQVMTADLYTRTHVDPASEDSHDNFVERRKALFPPSSS